MVSGWGLVHATGCGLAGAERAFARAECPLQEVDRRAGYHRRRGARLAALVGPEVDLSPYLSPRLARRMSPPSRHAVVAAQIALAQARLELTEPSATAVLTSTCYGPSSYTEELLHQIFGESPQAASPFLFTEAVANAPAAQIALMFKAQGPNITVTQREAGPVLALARAAAEVRRGRATRAIFAAADEMNSLLHAALDRFGALAGSRGGPEIARPFDRDRRGMIAAEGAVAALLEPADAALARGHRPLATVRAEVAAFDPSAAIAGYGEDPQTLGTTLRNDLARQGVAPSSIDVVVASAGGGRQSDRYEAQFLRAALGEDLPPVLAANGYAGQQGGMPLAMAFYVLGGGQVAPTPHFHQVDPELGLVPYAGGPLGRVAAAQPRRVLVSTPATGGAAAFLVLDRWEEESHG